MRRALGFMMIGMMLFLAACSGSNTKEQAPAPAPTQQKPAEKVALRWGIYADPARQEVSEQQAAAFNKSHANIEVKVEAVPFAQYYEKLGTQIASGAAYDVMMISGSYFPNIAPQGGFLDLTDRIKKDGMDLTKYTTEKANSELNGKVLAMPFELDIQALYYNKDLFDAAKVEYPNAKWTWDDLLAAAKKLTRTVDGKQTWGFYSDNLYPSWVSFIGQNGGAVFGSDGKTPTLDTPEVKGALKFLTDMIYSSKVSPAPGQLPQGVNPFHSGLVAMVVDGSYSVRVTAQTAKFKWDVAPLPTGKKRAVAYWTQGVAVYAKTKYPNESWEFAKFLASPEAQEILASTKMATPSLKSVANSDKYLKGEPANIKVFIDEFADAVPIPFNDKWFDLMRGPTSALGEPFSLLWLNKTSVDEAAAKAQSNVKKVMSGN